MRVYERRKMQKLQSSLNESLNESLNQRLQAKYPHLELAVLPLSQVKKDNEYFRIDSEPFKKSNLSLNNDIEYIKLSQIATINPSKTELQKYDNDLEVTFLSMQNLGNGFINEREKGTLKDFRSGYTYFAENDILVAKITPCMEHGKCAIATNLTNKIGFGSTEFNVFRVKDSRFMQEFIFCYLNRENIRKIATDNMVGTSGRQRVPTAFYENLLIPILPKDFQLEIERLVKDSHKALEDSKTLYKEAQNLLYESLGLDSTNPLESLMRDTLATSCHTEALAEVSKNDSVDLVISKDTHAKAPSAEGGGTKELHSAREGEKESCHDLKSPLPQHEGHLGVGSTRGDNVYCHLKRSEVSHHKDRDSSVASLPQNDKDMNDLWLGKKYPHLNISIRQLSQSYGKSGRLDSEYYQSKYDAIERIIKGFSHKKLGDLVTIQKSIEPGSEAYQDEGIEFVRVANLSRFGISKSNICVNRQDFGKDLEKLAPKKETILLSKDGSIGISYCLEEDLECITSGAILHLKVKDKNEILPQVLNLILNSITTRLQAERDSGGSIIAHWKISEIENVLIPLFDFRVQKQIAYKIQKSFALRKVAKDLLESAKSKVECAIEQGTR